MKIGHWLIMALLCFWLVVSVFRDLNTVLEPSTSHRTASIAQSASLWIMDFHLGDLASLFFHRASITTESNLYHVTDYVYLRLLSPTHRLLIQAHPSTRYTVSVF